MIKIKRNVKKGERRKLGIERSSKSKSESLRKSSPRCEMVSQPPSYEMVRKHFAKPRKVVKMPTKPRTMHLKRRALSLRSHMKPLTPFQTSLKPSEPIAPTEETMPPKETTRIEAKVLIQPTQEATSNASAP